MKKLILLGLMFIPVNLFAFGFGVSPNELTITTYSEVNTAVPIMFSSGPIRFLAVGIATPSANSYLAIFRSTTPTFTPDLSTQTVINTSFIPSMPYPLYDMTNTSYTFIMKTGNAGVTLFYNCLQATNRGLCPGIKWNGK